MILSEYPLLELNFQTVLGRFRSDTVANIRGTRGLSVAPRLWCARKAGAILPVEVRLG